MPDFTHSSDSDLFGEASEQPGSQASYQRDIEIRRREYLLNGEMLRAQLDATTAQHDATLEMRSQSKTLFWSTIAATVSAVAALATAVVTYLVAHGL